jgi:hypothetical protein
MAHEPLPGEQPGKIEALLQRWQTSLDLHARYAALDDARYWHVQPWPKHERPQRWIIQLARKRILALKRIVTQRIHEGDAAFVEGIETMAFLATLVGLTSVERVIPLATPETERGEVLEASPEESATPAAPAKPRAAPVTETARTRQMPVLQSPKAAPPRAPARVAAPARGTASRRRQAEEGGRHHPGRTRGDRGRGTLVRVGQAVARDRRNDRAPGRAALALGDPPGPANLPRAHRRHRQAPARLALP